MGECAYALLPFGSRRRPRSQFPNGRLADPKAGGQGLLREPEALPRGEDALRQGLALGQREVAQECRDAAKVDRSWASLPPFPVQDRRQVDAQSVGDLALGDAEVHPPAPEVLARRSGIGRIPLGKGSGARRVDWQNGNESLPMRRRGIPIADARAAHDGDTKHTRPWPSDPRAVTS
jgi:hypothetical protein